MSNFLAYIRNDKGGAVEYVMLIAAVGGIIAALGSNANVKNQANSMFTSVFNSASKKSTL